MNVDIFDSFSAASEENGLQVETIECPSSAHRRMVQIAAEKTGMYFMLSRTDPSILTRADTGPDR
jgi:hypothetical protein